MCVCIVLAAGQTALEMLLHQAGKGWRLSTRQGQLHLLTCKGVPAEVPSR